MKKKALLLTAGITLLGAIPVAFAATNPGSDTAGQAGQPLNAAQQAIKTGQANISTKIDSRGYSNLGQIISDEVKLHESNGEKFGGLNFSVINGSTETRYSLSGDVLHTQIFSYDSQTQQEGKLTSDTTTTMATTHSKFASLTPELVKLLNNVPMQKAAPAIDTSVAHAYSANPYDGYESSGYCSIWQDMYYYGSGYHDVDLTSHAAWTGTDNGEADPGPKDGLDAEWNPSNMYMASVVWQPNSYTQAGPFGWSGVHDIGIDQSGEWYGTNGGYYVEPDNNTLGKYVEVYLNPVSSSVYGQTSNYYANYIHTWDWYGGGSIGFSIGYGVFSISYAPSGTGSYRLNNWGTYTI